MLRVTDDVLELRRWAEARGGSPCRDAASGRLRIAFADDPCSVEVGWEEFEPAFCAARSVLVYDDESAARAALAEKFPILVQMEKYAGGKRTRVIRILEDEDDWAVRRPGAK
jgi:hypothetical protein